MERAAGRRRLVAVAGLGFSAAMIGCGGDGAATPDAAVDPPVSSMTVSDAAGGHEVVFDTSQIAGTADGHDWYFEGTLGFPYVSRLFVAVTTSGPALTAGDYLCADQSAVNTTMNFRDNGVEYYAGVTGGSCTVTVPPIPSIGETMNVVVIASVRTVQGDPGVDVTAILIATRLRTLMCVPS